MLLQIRKGGRKVVGTVETDKTVTTDKTARGKRTEKNSGNGENEEKICGERNDWHFKIHCFLSADKNHRTIERREATDG